MEKTKRNFISFTYTRKKGNKLFNRSYRKFKKRITGL